jgi:hypothetical protein
MHSARDTYAAETVGLLPSPLNDLTHPMFGQCVACESHS